MSSSLRGDLNVDYFVYFPAVEETFAPFVYTFVTINRSFSLSSCSSQQIIMRSPALPKVKFLHREQFWFRRCKFVVRLWIYQPSCNGLRDKINCSRQHYLRAEVLHKSAFDAKEKKKTECNSLIADNHWAKHFLNASASYHLSQCSTIGFAAQRRNVVIRVLENLSRAWAFLSVQRRQIECRASAKQKRTDAFPHERSSLSRFLVKSSNTIISRERWRKKK